MDRFSSFAAAIIAVSGMALRAHADFLLLETKTTTTIPTTFAPGTAIIGGMLGEPVDVVTFRIQNIGDGGYATGTKLDGIALTASIVGAGNFIFQTFDGVGDGGTSVNVTGIPNIAAGSSVGSYIRYGSAVSFIALYDRDPNGIAAAGGTLPENEQDPGGAGSSTFDPIANYTNIKSFTVVGGVNGGVLDTARGGINVASIVVPVGTTVIVGGLVGGDIGPAVPVFANIAVPEPISATLLALGVTALLARRGGM